MPISDYLRDLRAKVGATLLLVPSTTVAIRDDADRLLLVRHTETGLWVLPGGSMLPFETPADAAVREVSEETGLSIELTRIVGVYGGAAFVITYANGDRISYAMTTFEGHVTAGSPRPDGVETQEVGWYSQAEIAALPLATWAKLVIRDVFRPDDRSYFQAPLRRG